MKALFYDVLLIFHFVSCGKGDDIVGVNKEWFEYSQAFQARGGWVEETLDFGLVHHGGFDIRGVVATQSISEYRSIFEVPDHLIIKFEEFSLFKSTHLEELPGCGDAHRHGKLDNIKAGAVLAQETQKGEASKYHFYITSLPTLDDFKSFHPRLMQPSLQADFNGIFLVEMVQEMQKVDAAMQQCFEAWNRKPKSPVAKLSWNEVLLAMIRISTRAFDGGPAGHMIPGTDFLNTPDGPRKGNTEVMTMWGVLIAHTARNVDPKEELLFEYCSICDNTLMLSKWGVYLEDNLKGNGLTRTHRATCQAQPGARGSHAAASGLRKATETSLDIQSVNATKMSKMIVPRCLPEVLSTQQGPLRCSLARLSWELCAEDWGHDGQGVVALPKKIGQNLSSRSALAPSDAASFIDHSFIQAVHPQLFDNDSAGHRNVDFLKQKPRHIKTHVPLHS